MKRNTRRKIQKINKHINRNLFYLSFFVDELIKVEGFGLKTTKLLWEANLKSTNDILNASDAKLLEINNSNRLFIRIR